MSPSPSDEATDDDDEPNHESSDSSNTTTVALLSKKLIRLALSCSYARIPLRRSDISLKVFGPTHPSRLFQAVLRASQTTLRRTFGMELIELPVREKVTVSQRRAAQRVEKSATSTKAWILCSTLPASYRENETILTPSMVPTEMAEATYVGLYTFLISVIALSGGSLGEAKLERYLSRMNAEQYTPIEKTEVILQRMCRHGYLVKIRDGDGGGEEVVEYLVGPRGKVEVGAEGVAGVVKSVYGAGDGAEMEIEVEEIEKRVRRNLGLVMEDRQEQGNTANGGDRAETNGKRKKGAARRRRASRAREGDGDGEEEEEEDTDDGTEANDEGNDSG